MPIEQPRPFLRWVGGKAKLASQIIAHIPPTWNRETDLYVEPFLGGGAVFFALQPKRALLNDANGELISLYGAVRDTGVQLYETLSKLRRLYCVDPEQTYSDVRTLYNCIAGGPERDDLEQSARLLFLNKTCFNGLYRVNADGGFNVPWGQNPNAGFPTLEHLQCCSEALQGATLLSHDFTELDGKFDLKGALVYFDPPYMPMSPTSNFTGYTVGGFNYAAQLHLAVQAAYWRDAGAHVILSQAADESLVDQYRRLGFRTDLVQVPRSVNSRGDKRGPVGEYIIY